MAKPLPNEASVYARIREERITIPPQVWVIMYYLLGDYISFINLALSYHIDRDQPVPVEDARKILEYTRRIRDVMTKILRPETISPDDPILAAVRAVPPLHPLVKDLFTHYLGNDVHIINLCVSFDLDPLDEQPVAVKDAQKVLPCTITMRQFLDRLREATSETKGF